MICKETRHGRMIFPEKDMCVGASLDAVGEFKQAEIEFLCALLQPGDVAIDVGANVGAITIPLAKRVGSKGYVLALEAHSTFFYCLCGGLALNDLKNVQAFNRAASDRTGAMFYYPHFDFSAPGYFADIKLAGLLNSKDQQGNMCDNPATAIAIDDLGISAPKLIKIDVNGMESSVLNGAKKTISRAKPILYVAFKENWKAIFDFMKFVDYECAVQVAPTSEVWCVSTNLVCWHKDKKPENLDETLFVDLDADDYKQMKEARDGDTADFSVVSD